MRIFPFQYAIDYISLQYGNNQSHVARIDKFFPINIHRANHRLIVYTFLHHFDDNINKFQGKKQKTEKEGLVKMNISITLNMILIKHFKM